MIENMVLPDEKLITSSSFMSSILEDRPPSLPGAPLPFRKNCPHLALPASFFNRFSLARLLRKINRDSFGFI